MRILIITPRLDKNHSILGFIDDWILSFSNEFEKVVVITPNIGKYTKKRNVEVHHAKGRFKLIKTVVLIYLLIKNIRKVDVVFAHMYPVFGVISFPIAKAFRKKCAMWYVHKKSSFMLNISINFADVVFSVTEETLPVETHKACYVGHGINTNKFRRIKMKRNKNEVISVGRISRIKKYEVIISSLKRINKDIILKIIGPIWDKAYYKDLCTYIEKNNLSERVVFAGIKNQEELIKEYNKTFIFISASESGVDKAILESMACEQINLIKEKAFEKYLPKKISSLIIFNDDKDLAKKIEEIISFDEKEYERIGKELRKIVLENFSLNSLVKKIKKKLEEININS